MPPEKRIADRAAISGTVSRALSKFLLAGRSFFMPSTKISRFQQQNKRFGKIFRRGGDTDVQYSAVLSEDIPYGSLP